METEVAEAGPGGAEQHVTALYQAHALGLARLALVLLGDQAAAEDVVQDAFFGLFRRWSSLSDPAAVPSYLRTSVLNGCRTALRRQARRGVLTGDTAGEDEDASGQLHPAAATARRSQPGRRVARHRLVANRRVHMDAAATWL